MMRAILLGLLALGTTAALAAPDPAPDRWAPLPRAEQKALVATLKKSDPGNITVACAQRGCAALAASIEEAFVAAGWVVTRVRTGGLGVGGVHGVRVSGCNDPRLVTVAHALAGRTGPGETEVIVNPACSGADEIVVVIGDKP